MFVIIRTLIRKNSLVCEMEEGLVWERQTVIESLAEPLLIPEQKEWWAHQPRWGIVKEYPS